MDGPTNETTHRLLLALAGRVDDDLLGWARELAAVGEEARAVSLLTADITASRTALPAPARAALVAAGQAVRVDIVPADLAPAADDDSCVHRFVADVAGQQDVAAALRGLPARRLQDCTVHLAWRLTPAGAAPGPLPHPVVLVEAEPGVRALDVLAYQVATGLVRSGVHAGVEVLAVGQPRESYHETALADAVPVSINDEPGAARAVAPAEVTPPPMTADPRPRAAEPVAEIVPETHRDPTGEREPAPVTVADRAPEIAPEIVAEIVAEVPPAGTVPEYVPESAREPEFALDPSRPHPLSDDAILPPTQPIEVSPPLGGAPVHGALNDPFSGPLDRPLLPARFDPTIQPHDPLGIDYLIGPSESARRAAEQRPEPVRVPEPPATEAPAAERPAAGPPAVEPRAAQVSPIIDESWAAEWDSGAWAMPVEDVAPMPVRDDTPHNGFRARYDVAPGIAEFLPPSSEPAHDRPGPDRPGPDQPAAHRRPARHTYQPEPTPEPVRHQVRPEPTPLRRGEAGSRLSDADRELLARLQAELVEGRKPRVTRRAGVAHIQPIHNRGSDDEPPDLAG